ncbi:NAD-dependent epimerase/dehydratase family protein [Ramlibacter sp.]|uniref:NAD-dependent epimerase/dehydratase family protein n=1 Tax=Ramlibacter sp. TaxID=1917967 RepID=UPI00183089E9|nr:NAD-dependent epimerase/dehydratase family protein [Ramlibacter sp.]MBA2675048.1 NAD-dependent epimerase/dehydratase family protein [Ramlibacter sp.]
MTDTTHIVLGAGPTGSRTAQLLADAGEHVLLASRRGGTPAHARIRHVAQDATDAQGLTRLFDGAATVINCTMPPYDRWPEEFPPIADAVLRAVRGTGTRLLTLGNVYGYGQPAGNFTEDLPMRPVAVKGHVRARMWLDALDSGATVAEVRASDYFGKGAVSVFTLQVLPQILAGGAARYTGDVDLPHSWSYVGDVARTLAAVARREDTWGRAWHVPSHDLTLRELARAAARLAGRPAPELAGMDFDELLAFAASGSMQRELLEMRYMFYEQRLIEARDTTRLLGIAPAPLEEALRDMLF